MSKKKTGKVNQIRKILAGNIKFYRQKKNITQMELAEKTGLAGQTIKNFEKGRTWGQDCTVTAIAKALKIKVWELYVPKKRQYGR